MPTRKQALVFAGKAKIFQGKRTIENLLAKIQRHESKGNQDGFQIVGESSTPLWTEDHAAERELTAGKIQNLRVAAKSLDRVVVPAGEIFSFWKQVGRITTKKGYVVGRELREGCIIPNLGGGLCQLSNGLYNAALKAGFETVERHAHSQQVPGSLAAVGRDATVFWNYVDLRFRHTHAFQISVRLSKNHLHIQLLSQMGGHEQPELSSIENTKVAEVGNCLSCGVNACFRNVPAEKLDKALGTTSYLLDAYTPEFQSYLTKSISNQDQVLLPIHAKRWRAPAYRWSVPTNDEGHQRVQFATRIAFARSLKLRSLPPEGGVLQKTLLKYDRKLAKYFASRIDHRSTHLVVSQNLLPHLWELGAMGGRTFDVWATRYPMEILQSKLDVASEIHPTSPTLADFRVSENLAGLETEAFKNARRVITPHYDVGRNVAEVFGIEVDMLDWAVPEVNLSNRLYNKESSDKCVIAFPASPLGKKGVYEFRDALKGIDAEVLILGTADEGVVIPNSRHASVSEVMQADVLVLPAYVEHSPRPLLRALALGIPVIASKACGIPEQDGLTIVDYPDQDKLRSILEAMFPRG